MLHVWCVRTECAYEQDKGKQPEHQMEGKGNGEMNEAHGQGDKRKKDKKEKKRNKTR